jgi:proline racemase
MPRRNRRSLSLSPWMGRGAAGILLGLCQHESMSGSAPGRHLMVTTVDYHTAGEPFRIVSGGVPALRGHTIMEKRRYALEHLDDIRQLLVFEPRGHADMYGGFVTEPEDGGAALGVVFFHNAGYSTACGHGTIALVTWAIEAAIVSDGGPSTEVVVDVPSGRLRTVATVQAGRVRSVRFRNVPSFVLIDAFPVTAGGRRVETAVAYGGAFYAIVPADRFELPIEPAFVPRFIELGREIKAAIESTREIVHPLTPDLEGIYGVMFTAGNRNITVFADGEVDRSPCGSGTSARLALLDQRGELARGATLMHESVIGGRFSSRVVDEARVGDYPAVVTEVEGSAHLTGYHQFVLDADDPIGLGFLIR